MIEKIKYLLSLSMNKDTINLDINKILDNNNEITFFKEIIIALFNNCNQNNFDKKIELLEKEWYKIKNIKNINIDIDFLLIKELLLSLKECDNTIESYYLLYNKSTKLIGTLKYVYLYLILQKMDSNPFSGLIYKDKNFTLKLIEEIEKIYNEANQNE